MTSIVRPASCFALSTALKTMYLYLLHLHLQSLHSQLYNPSRRLSSRLPQVASAPQSARRGPVIRAPPGVCYGPCMDSPLVLRSNARAVSEGRISGLGRALPPSSKGERAAPGRKFAWGGKPSSGPSLAAPVPRDSKLRSRRGPSTIPAQHPLSTCRNLNIARSPGQGQLVVRWLFGVLPKMAAPALLPPSDEV